MIGLVAATLPGCAAMHHPSDEAPESEGGGRATVRVDNQRYLDMDIYAVYESQHIRLGTVTGNSVGVFELPRQFVGATMEIQFLAAPIGGNASPISDGISVYPGDEVDLLIVPY
jgi:hypothetical protein